MSNPIDVESAEGTSKSLGNVRIVEDENELVDSSYRSSDGELDISTNTSNVEEAFENERSIRTSCDVEEGNADQTSGNADAATGDVFGDERSHRSHHTAVTAATAGTSSVNNDTCPASKSFKSAKLEVPVAVIDDSFRSDQSEQKRDHRNLPPGVLTRATSFDAEPNLLYDQLAATAREEACERKSQLCCGSCCDLVRACIIVNIFDIILVTALLIVWAVIGLEEDMAKDITGVGGMGRIVVCIAIPFGLLGIYGALKFNKYAVLLTGIWYIVYLVLCAVHKVIFTTLVSVFFAYPHIHLALALHAGTITAQNYSVTEKYCCCGFSSSARRCRDGCD